MNIKSYERNENDIKRCRQRCEIDGVYYNLPIKLFRKIEKLNKDCEEIKSIFNTPYINCKIAASKGE